MAMRPKYWEPPIELSPTEALVVKRIKRAKLFVFLRQIRHELFDVTFQEELNRIFLDSEVGQPPVPGAQIALTILLQAYTGASDDEAIEALVMDRRWQLVLNCLDCEQAPFSKATLVRGRQRLIKHRLDRRLVERTVELASQRGGFGPRQLRAALDSSPLWGAGRVEDTYNLLGHAMRKAVGVVAAQQGGELSQMSETMGVSLLRQSSLKAGLDINWDDPEARCDALVLLVNLLETVTKWVEQGTPPSPVAQAALDTAQQIKTQDIELSDTGRPQLKQKVARNRRISIEDPHMRHGRKSRRQRVDGYKRHVLRDLDSGLIPCVGVTPANVPEAWITDAIQVDLKSQQLSLRELSIDRAYLTSKLVRQRDQSLTIYCKAWPVRHRQGLFPKTAFTLDWEAQTLCCPNQVTLPLRPGHTVRFPSEICAKCPLQAQCTTSDNGRSVSIHPDESFFQELRERQSTPQGRAKLRERVRVEHALAHIGAWQGDRARYRTLRKNLFDLRRMAVIHNLHIFARMLQPPSTAAN
jgi:hypothetical protein